MATEEQFADAASRIKGAPPQPPNRLLELYALYKQATVGDVQGDRPGMMDIKGRAKYDAWAKVKGVSKEQARDRYVALVDEILAG